MIITHIDEQMATDYWTLEAMRKFGGGFVKQLGIACAHADKENLARVKTAFPEYWKCYEHMGLSMRNNKEKTS